MVEPEDARDASRTVINAKFEELIGLQLLGDHHVDGFDVVEQAYH